MKTLIFLSLLAAGASVSLAATDSSNTPPATTMTWTIAKKAVDFASFPGKHLVISTDCVQQDSSLSCQAYNALPNASLTKMTGAKIAGKLGHGGANPGATICGHQLGGKIITGKDTQSNEQSFCKFKDGSLVSTASILYWANQNPGSLK